MLLAASSNRSKKPLAPNRPSSESKPSYKPPHSPLLTSPPRVLLIELGQLLPTLRRAPSRYILMSRSFPINVPSPF